MITSKNTSINQIPKMFKTVTKHFGWKKGTFNLDVGGGRFDTATQYLTEQGVFNYIYDPYNRTVEHNHAVLELLNRRRADSVTIANVLNVISSKDEMLKVLRISKAYLRTNGICYISCYHAPKKGESKKDCYQQGEPLEWYVPLVKMVFGNVEKKHNLLIARRIE